MRAGDDEPSAADLVLTKTPPDDAGARTADQYEWQAVMATADGLRLYLDALDPGGNFNSSGTTRVVCEHHEDWVALRDEDAELVSAKHPGLPFGAYSTLNSLADDGGVAHLFNRWLTMGEKPTCRLVTTAGASDRAHKLVEIAVTARQRRLDGEPFLPDPEQEELLTGFGRALLKHCDGLPQRWTSPNGGPPESIPTADHRQQIIRFLSIFTFQDSVPRKYAPYAAPAMFAQPVLDRLGSTAPAGSVWEAVLAVFRARMRAAGPTPIGGLPPVLADPVGAASPTPAVFEADLASRIVTLTDIDLAIRTAIANPTGFAPLPRLMRTSRLAIKMEVGGCTDNTVERAEQLRADYTDFWRDPLAADPSARTRQQRLHRLLLRISDAATDRVKKPAGRWGADLWRQLEADLDQHQDTLPVDMDADLALGGLCELSNRCKVWFSDSFDIASEQARRRPAEGAGS
ncbi:hypothetical protein Ate02nite_84420 [Paractinoplanes tereljensis]|uniref:DUF4297 domain-containing protein n=2 Tax=Paractinoplanes tereljensis TaxID=571912 RepID=A0A919NXX3_9ACTN|nr:hypothetical protein Ate02nite_84420 [Actinoplanes tereljensis]